jgi:hypothetical protein
MLRRYEFHFGAVLALVGCSSEQDDPLDHNRPATYGLQCASASDCASPFECLGIPDGGAYLPICTIRCGSVSDCPTWSATGHCPGPITPLCVNGLCDYSRCK